jgi:hypothetical protein
MSTPPTGSRAGDTILSHGRISSASLWTSPSRSNEYDSIG